MLVIADYSVVAQSFVVDMNMVDVATFVDVAMNDGAWLCRCWVMMMTMMLWLRCFLLIAKLIFKYILS